MASEDRTYIRIVREQRGGPFEKQAGRRAVKRLEVVLPSGEAVMLSGVMDCTLLFPLDGIAHAQILVANFEEVYE